MMRHAARENPLRVVRSVLAAAALIVAVTTSARLALADAVLTDEELVAQSGFVVVGIVSNVASAWNVEGTQILSVIDVDVEDTLKGTLPSSVIQMRVLGGSADGITMTVYDTPLFTRGEEVVLFLRENYESFFPLAGTEEGKLLVVIDPATSGKVVTRPDRPDVPLPIFESDIQAIVAAQAPIAGEVAPPPDVPEIPGP